MIAGHDRALASKFSGGLNHLHAEPGEALDGIIRCDGRDDGMDVVMHGGVIDSRFNAHDAELLSRTHGLSALAGRNQRLGRHTTVVEAVTTHFVLFDQHNLLPKRRCSGSHREPAGPRADDAQVGSDCVAAGGVGRAGHVSSRG